MNHALVIGGGVAGLLAAHALARFAQRVTVLERHSYTNREGIGPPGARRGVPQARCLHLLTAAGGLAVDQLVPGWRARAEALGAVPFDASADTALHLPSGWAQRGPSGLSLLACSRAVLEQVLLEALLERPGTAVLQGRAAVALLRDGPQGAVHGVRCADADPPLRAELVVDASGAASALPAWLGQPVAETRHLLGLHYLSRWLRLAPGEEPAWRALSIAPSAENGHRCAMLLRAEHGYWGLVLLAPDGKTLPQSDAAVLAFTQDLAGGALHAVLARSTPCSPLHRLGTTDSRIRHLERVPQWPQGLVALGDAVCRLDPYHGFGMTLAARAACLLRQHLDQAAPFDAAAFQHALAAHHAVPWEQATRLDTDGRPLGRSAQPVQQWVARAATDLRAARALVAWQQLMSREDGLLQEALDMKAHA